MDTSKVETLREGIAKHFRPHTLGDIDDDLTGIISGVAVGTMELYRIQADELIEWLDSQGVVRKVERELPKVPQAEIAPMYDKVFREGINAGQYSMLKAGYVAVEPLIKGAI